MRRVAASLIGLTVAAEVAANDAVSQEATWTPSVRGGYVHQFDGDLEAGADFSVRRSFLQAGLSYVRGPRRRVSISVGAGTDRYDFSSGLGLADGPWSRIDQLRLSLPVTWALDDTWTLFAIPTLRYSGETGASSSDSATGGLFTGLSYRVGNALTIGPGIGVLGQLEDSVKVLPILLIDWKITDRLKLETGRGLGATQGPGLVLSYLVSETWSLGLGARYESLRFRLDEEGRAPNGVGEDQSVPIYASATYSQGRDLRISAVAGVKLNGELRLEDASGRLLERGDYGSTPFLGAAFDLRF